MKYLERRDCLKKVGVILKEFRTSKNLSLEFVTKDIMSTAQLSKFERSEVDITCDKFLKVLKRINITLEEFSLAQNDFSLSGLEEILYKTKKYYGENNANKLNILLCVEIDNYKETGVIYHLLNTICIKGYLYDIDQSPESLPSKKESQIINDYLLSVDDWSYYELLLFSNCIKFINSHTSILLAKEMTKKNFFYRNLPKNKRIIIKTLINIFIACCENSLFKDAHYFKNVISSMLKDETFLYERNVFLFAKGLFFLKTDEKNLGISMMNDSIKIFKELGCDNLFSNYKKYFDDLDKS